MREGEGGNKTKRDIFLYTSQLNIYNYEIQTTHKIQCSQKLIDHHRIAEKYIQKKNKTGGKDISKTRYF